jgi:hypothetical protein
LDDRRAELVVERAEPVDDVLVRASDHSFFGPDVVVQHPDMSPEVLPG